MGQKLTGFVWLQTQGCLAYALATLAERTQMQIQRYTVLNYVPNLSIFTTTQNAHPSHSHPIQSHINTKKKHTFLFLFSSSEFLAAAATTAGGTIGNRIAIDTGVVKVRFHI